jgi:tRNA dimethylallyltransferase
LDGQLSLSDCVAAVQQATRHYAKRQLTWFGGQPIFQRLNLSLLKDQPAAVDWILQKISLLPSLE